MPTDTGPVPTVSRSGWEETRWERDACEPGAAAAASGSARGGCSRRSASAPTRAVGVDHGSLKTFRSTVATQLADAGLHPSKIQAFLGHVHVTTTMTYYTAITDVDEAADLLPDL